jgi:hypothetical protein
MGERRADDPRLFGVACLAAAATLLVVSAGFAVPLVATSSMSRPLWILVLTAGICAATSLTLPAGSALEARTPASRVIELGVLPPIVAGGLVLAWLDAGSAGGAAVLLLRGCVLSIALAAAAWLLLERTSSETEERVFGVAALLLVGGVAAALGLSALFGGLIAGLFWRYAGRHPRGTISRDVLFVQHPLLVLVLLVAGARAEISLASVALGAAYVALRVIGQLGGARLASYVAGATAPPDLGLHLLPPGVFGVALALNAIGIVGADAAMLLGAVVVGTIGSELVAYLLPPRSVAA